MKLRRNEAAFAVLSLIAVAPAQERATPPPLLAPARTVPAAARAWDAQQRQRYPALLRSRFARVDVAALRRGAGRAPAPPASFTVDLFGAQHVLDVTGWEPVLGNELFTGSIRGRPGGATLAVAPDGVVAATIHLVGETFAITYTAAGDVHVVQQWDESRSELRCGALHGARVERVLESDHGTGPTDDSGNTILDVMMFFTPAARDTSGGTSGMEVAAINAIAQANATNKASSVAATFRLVYVGVTSYSETGGSIDLRRFRTPSDGYMDEVHGLRDTYGGDLMHLITQPVVAQYCGVAYLMTRLTAGFRSSAFGVTVHGCMQSNVVAHELGHNIGCHHDRNNAGGAIYPYAYGYRTPDSAYRTVMAYSPGARVNAWSSPNVKFGGYVMGRPNSEDNARTITNTKATVASFKPMTSILWCDAGGGIPGFFGIVPVLLGEGTKDGAHPVRVRIDRYRPRVPGLLVIGAKALRLPFFGGTLVPSADVALPVAGTGPRIPVAMGFVNLLQAGSSLLCQVFFLDDAARRGASASNGVKVTRP